MDPNAEERPATAHIAEVDVDIQTEVRQIVGNGNRTDRIVKSGTSFESSAGTFYGQLDIQAGIR
jgi:hypothetical protein